MDGDMAYMCSDSNIRQTKQLDRDLEVYCRELVEIIDRW